MFIIIQTVIWRYFLKCWIHAIKQVILIIRTAFSNQLLPLGKNISTGFKNEEYDGRYLIKWHLPIILSRISTQWNATLSMTNILFSIYNSANLSKTESINWPKLSLLNGHVCLTLCRIFLLFTFCKLNAKLCNWSEKSCNNNKNYSNILGFWQHRVF